MRRFVEENLFAVWMQGIMDSACSTNEPGEQEAIVRAATVLNYARGTDFIDWLYDGEGRMRVFVPNDYFRDGAPYESTGGYNAAHVVHLTPVVDAMEQLRQLRPDVYTETRYPPLSKSRRYRHIFDFCMDTVTIDRSYPYIGDGGSWPAYKKLPKIAWHDANAASFEHAYRLFRDPKFAWALVHTPGWKPSADFPFTREEIEREAAKWPDDWNDRSSLHDGYGVAILRSGQGDDKRALWMRYGRARSHTQDDLMDIGLQAFQGILLSHMGYPRNWGYWEHSWTSHNVARQIPFCTMTAQAELFAEAGPVRIAEARAQACVDRVDGGEGYELPPDQWQRRLLALVDVGPDRFYCVDFYRISGGAGSLVVLPLPGGRFHHRGHHARQSRKARWPDRTCPTAIRNGSKSMAAAKACTAGAARCLPLPTCTTSSAASHRSRGGRIGSSRPATGCTSRLTVASADGAEVNICDGRSPAGGPYEMKWIMLHNQAEASRQDPGGQPDRAAFRHAGHPRRPSARALRRRRAGIRRARMRGPVGRPHGHHTVLGRPDDPANRPTARSSFAGRFGFYREKQGIPLAMSLVGGTRLSKGRFGITLDSAEYRGKIVRVDRSAETITIAPPPPDLAAMVGAEIFITNPDRRVAYKVSEAKSVAEGAELRLNWDSRIGVGRCTGAADHRIRTNTPFTLQRYRYYHGARVTNADGSAEYRILDARSRKAVILDGKAHPDAKADKLSREFPQRLMVRDLRLRRG